MLPGPQHCLSGCSSHDTGNSPMPSTFGGGFPIVKKRTSSPKIGKTEVQVARKRTGESFYLFIFKLFGNK